MDEYSPIEVSQEHDATPTSEQSGEDYALGANLESQGSSGSDQASFSDGHQDPVHPSKRDRQDTPSTPNLPRSDDQATAVILVCRNDWNTINTRPSGVIWISA